MSNTIHKVTRNQLLHYTLKNQGLLERISGDPDSLIYPLHATSHTTPFLSLLARYNNFSDEGWKSLCSTGEQAFFLSRCMRGTLHYVPVSLKPTISVLYHDTEGVDEEEGDKKTIGKRYDTSGLLEQFDIPEEEADSLASEIVQAITKHGPQNTVSIKKLLPKKLIKKRELGGNVGIVMRRMLSQGKLEYGSTSTRITWRKKERLFSIPVTAPTSTSTPKPQPVSYELALVNLAFFYFERYGPASVDDFIWWAGLSPITCRVAVKTILPELAHVRATGIDEDLFMLKTRLDALKACADATPKMVRMLPYEDAIIKAYKATRYRFFGDKEEAVAIALRHSITKGGEAKPTLWVDGSIVGIWSWTNKPQQPIGVCVFKTLNKAEKKRVEEEIAIVSKFLESSGASWTTL